MNNTFGLTHLSYRTSSLKPKGREYILCLRLRIMAGYISDIIKQAARDLRKKMTQSEKLLWDEIKNTQLGYKFLRQKPIYVYTENRGQDRYIIPDFCCLELKLIIEVDGEIHEKPDIIYQDTVKQKLLKNKNFHVIRIKNEEIETNIQNVLKRIEKSFP